MPGPEDYPYEHEDAQPSQFAPLTTEVSQADSNPAYYPPEAKSEDLLTEEEKEEVSKKSAKEQGKTDVVDGQGNVLFTQEEATAEDRAVKDKTPVDPDLAAPTDDKRAAREAAVAEQAQADVEEKQQAEEKAEDKPADTSTKRSVPKAKSS